MKKCGCTASPSWVLFRVFSTITRLVLSEEAGDLRQAVFRAIPPSFLEQQLIDAQEWLTGSRSDVFPFVKKRYGYLRRFSPVLLRHINFESDRSGLTDAIDLLHQLNEDGKRKLPDEAPRDFLPKKTRSFIETENGLDRAGYECAVLTAIRDEVRRGNLWVRGSKRFTRLDAFFMPDDQWQNIRADFFARSGLPVNSKEATEYLKNRLDNAYHEFLQGLPRNAYVKIVPGGSWRFGSDKAEEPRQKDELAHLTDWIGERVRRIRLPDLLIEVDNDLQLTGHFFPKAKQRGAEDVCQIIATIMAYGCNLGPKTMASLTRGVTYKQIKRIADWQLNEDTLRSALAGIVNAISNHDTAQVWGSGETSSSDGQRFLFPRKSVRRTYSHRLGDYALEFYSFITDNYAPFYTTPIEATERDSGYVLDGLLYHESDIDPVEHYTDTHGYTEINHAAFAFLGKRFCPRIRGLSKQRIYHTNADKDYGPLQPMLSKRQLHLDWIGNEWDRIAQLFASFAYGHTTASIALKRLVAFGPNNHFYRATRELGRFFKTEFLLEYLAQPELRKRVRQGLLKSEQLHALARSVFYGKLGRADWQDFHRQMSAASCLLLILASIIYWQIKEIERVISEASEEEVASLQLDLLSHVSPIGWENVMLYGQYVFKRELVKV